MDIVLAANESVEQEGWLLKRGAGYDGEQNNKSEKFGGGLGPKGFGINPLGKIDELLAGKAERRRYFVLVKTDDPNEPSAKLYYFVKQPKIQKDRGKETAESNKHKRVIELTSDGSTTVSLEDGAKAFKINSIGRTYFVRPEDIGTEAELAYTAGQWVESIRNVISWLSKKIMKKQMHANKKSSTEFFNRLSFNMNMSYEALLAANGMADRSGSFTGSYRLSFRGSRSPSIVMPEKVPETLKDILENELYKREFKDFLDYARATENLKFWDKVNEYEEKSKLLQEKARKNDIRIFAKSICTEYIAEESEYQVNISSAQRKKILAMIKDNKATIDETLFLDAKKEIFLLMETNFFQRFYKELMKRTGCFAALYHSCDMDGYDVVIGNHFGSVMAETNRLKQLYTSRLQQTQKQISILEDSLRFSHEVAVPQLSTTQDSLMSLYETSLFRLEELVAFKNQLEKNLKLLEILVETVNTKLNEIVMEDKVRIQQFEMVQKDLADAEEKERTLDMCHRMFTKNAITEEDANARLKKYKITHEHLESELENAKASTKIAQTKTSDAKIALKEDLSISLNDLEKLDLHRLCGQQEIVRDILVAENNLNENITSQLEKSTKIAERTNIEADLKGFATYLNGSLTEKVFSL